MARKTKHPEREILDLMNGALTGPSRDAVEGHLAQFSKCAVVAAVVGALKNQAHSQAVQGPDSTARRAGGSGPVADGSALPIRTGLDLGPGQATPPIGRKDLEFKDLLQDASLSRPDLTQGLGSTNTFLESVRQAGPDHLDAAELASFFYGEMPRGAAAAAAGHLAMCSACASAISLHCDSHAAAQSPESSASAPSMSAESWKLIREWEENCLAEPRPESETPSREMLERFLEILRDHREEIDRVATGSAFTHALGTAVPQVVPVVVLDSAGGFRGVEPFHRVSRPRGLEALQYIAHPYRFHNLPIHALLGTERQYPMVISGRINRDIAELDYGSVQAGLMRPLGYFIVEN